MRTTVQIPSVRDRSDGAHVTIEKTLDRKYLVCKVTLAGHLAKHFRTADRGEAINLFNRWSTED